MCCCRGPDAQLAERLDAARITELTQLVPDAWLQPDAAFADPSAQRDAYRQYFLRRLQAPRSFASMAEKAHAAL